MPISNIIILNYTFPITLPLKDDCTNFSLSGSMSKTEGAKVSLGSSVESSVESVINDNIKILGRNFQSQHDLSDFSSVQDQGNYTSNHNTI